MNLPNPFKRRDDAEEQERAVRLATFVRANRLERYHIHVDKKGLAEGRDDVVLVDDRDGPELRGERVTIYASGVPVAEVRRTERSVYMVPAEGTRIVVHAPRSDGSRTITGTP